MRLYLSFTLALMILGIFSCNPYHSDELHGQWQAVSLTEEGDSLAVDPQEIRFEFMEGDQYSFQSTLAYKEAGTFRLDGPYLFTTDTLINGLQLEKAVAIQSLANDSLVILMQDRGKERILVLVRQ